MLACSHKRLRTVTVLGEKAYFDARNTAPKVCPLLLNIGRQIIERCILSRASEENRGSDAASSRYILVFVFSALEA